MNTSNDTRSKTSPSSFFSYANHLYLEVSNGTLSFFFLHLSLSSPLLSSSLGFSSSTITPDMPPSLVGLPALPSLLLGLSERSRLCEKRECSLLAAVGSSSAIATGVAMESNSPTAPKSLVLEFCEVRAIAPGGCSTCGRAIRLQDSNLSKPSTDEVAFQTAPSSKIPR